MQDDVISYGRHSMINVNFYCIGIYSLEYDFYHNLIELCVYIRGDSADIHTLSYFICVYRSFKYGWYTLEA